MLYDENCILFNVFISLSYVFYDKSDFKVCLAFGSAFDFAILSIAKLKFFFKMC